MYARLIKDKYVLDVLPKNRKFGAVQDSIEDECRSGDVVGTEAFANELDAQNREDADLGQGLSCLLTIDLFDIST